MPESLEILFEHIARTIPDISRQRRLLQALAKSLPTNHPGHKTVVGMLSALNGFETLQESLPACFASDEKPSTRKTK